MDLGILFQKLRRKFIGEAAIPFVALWIVGTKIDTSINNAHSSVSTMIFVSI